MSASCKYLCVYACKSVLVSSHVLTIILVTTSGVQVTTISVPRCTAKTSVFLVTPKVWGKSREVCVCVFCVCESVGEKCV